MIALGMQPVVDFILELEKLKSVTRKIRPLGLDRYESSAEHSWQIAMLASSLAPHAEPGVDLAHVISMLLVHDIGEIDAGDTFFFAEGADDAKAKERAGVERIFALLPEAERARFLALWSEFDDGTSADARFAHAVDRAMPVLLNLANHGQSWRENGVSHAQVVKRVGPPVKAGCPALWVYLEARLDDAERTGWFGAHTR